MFFDNQKGRKAIIASLAMCVIVFLLIGYFSLQNTLNPRMTVTAQAGQQIPLNQNRIVSLMDDSALEPFPMLKEDLDGSLWLGLLDGEWNGDITLDTPQDEIVITVANASQKRTNLMLKVFYNYEEVAFHVVGTDIIDTELLFALDGAYKVDIPLQLPEHLTAGETISKLTVCLFFEPKHFVGSDEAISDDLRFSSGIALNFEINYGFGNDLSLNTDRFEDFYESEFGGFAIHPDPQLPGGGALRFLSNPLVVGSDEELHLSFFANADKDVDLGESYIIISMLDWHQIAMDGNPYLWVNFPNGCIEIGQHGQFSIMTPAEPGFYEYVGLLIPQPTRLNSEQNFFPLEIVRFTIEVAN